MSQCQDKPTRKLRIRILLLRQACSKCISDSQVVRLHMNLGSTHPLAEEVNHLVDEDEPSGWRKMKSACVHISYRNPENTETTIVQFFFCGFPWFQSFKVLKFLSFKVSKFQSANVSKFQKYQRCVGHSFPFLANEYQVSKHTLLNLIVFSWIIWSVLVSPKIKIIGFGAQGHVRKSRNHRNEWFEGSHMSKSKSYKFKLEQNNSTELLSIPFP